VRFQVRVSPRASRDAILGLHGDALKVALKAPPVEGAANAALVALLARHLGVGKRDVSVVAGEASKLKTLLVRGVTTNDVQALCPSDPAQRTRT
jgi:uncharacterized protein (TIGR00251 family)